MPARPARARSRTSGLGAWLRHCRLQTKLIGTHAAVGAIVIVLALLAARYVQGQADERQAERAVVTAGTQELFALAASASEEGFSYVLSGDRDERARFELKLDAATRRCEALLSATLPEQEERSLVAVLSDVKRLRGAGSAMFDAFEATHRFATDRYAAYDAAIDRTWSSIAALDSVARADSAQSQASTRRMSERLFLGIGLLAIAVAAGLGNMVGRRLGRPLSVLRDAAVAFGKGNDHPTVQTDDEIGDVVRAFETMKERVRENQKTLIVTEQMAVIGRLTAGIAHELSSPLAAIVLTTAEMTELAQGYEKSTADPATQPAEHLDIARGLRECAEIAGMAAKQAAEYVRSIRSQSRTTVEGRSERFEVVTVLRDCVALVRHAARAAKCEVSLVTDVEHAELYGVPSALAHAITNLLQNAIDAMDETGGGRVMLRLEGDAGEVRIVVADTGPGIPPAVLPRIFESLYTTKRYGKGTGLGLPIVKKAIEQDFAGRIGVETAAGQGTTFTLSIPRRMAA